MSVCNTSYIFTLGIYTHINLKEKIQTNKTFSMHIACDFLHRQKHYSNSCYIHTYTLICMHINFYFLIFASKGQMISIWKLKMHCEIHFTGETRCKLHKQKVYYGNKKFYFLIKFTSRFVFRVENGKTYF